AGGPGPAGAAGQTGAGGPSGASGPAGPAGRPGSSAGMPTIACVAATVVRARRRIPALRCTVTVAGGASVRATAVRNGRRVAVASGRGRLRITIAGRRAAQLTVTTTPRGGAARTVRKKVSAAR
ncbi:hypothetical protein VSS74_26725, partial [Conexibacter stalactiti]|nr:hypothetical protein [Conexibacter stalactiti]MEC5038620.1 hypothetical protein [Conexibacter stalactiti]